MNIQTPVDPTNDLVEQARRVLPGGSFGNMPAEVILKEGRGGRIYDEAGKEYVDFLLGSGPMFIGHAHPEVTAVGVAWSQARLPAGALQPASHDQPLVAVVTESDTWPV